MDYGHSARNGGETIKILSHSMGGAYAEGMVKYFEENGTYKVEKILHLSMADPSEISVNKNPTTIQLNYQNDPVLEYKNFGENNYSANTDISGTAQLGSLGTSHATTKFDPNVFKVAEDLENIQLTPDPSESKLVNGSYVEPNPRVATYVPSGNTNGTTFKEINKKLTPAAYQNTNLKNVGSSSNPKYKIR